MSVVATNSYTLASGNGATSVFPFTFACRDPSQVAVYVNNVIQLSGFSVSLNSGFNGGTVSFTAAPAAGANIIIASDPSFMQPIAFENAGPYNPATVDDAFDIAAIRAIYLAGLLARAPLVPIGETIGPLPDKNTRPGHYYAWDADGNPTAATSTGGGDTSLRTDLAGTAGASLVGYPNGQSLQSVIRAPQTADVNYFVRTDGSDLNSGLINSPSGAFLTIQKAIDTAYNSLDFKKNKVIIHVADGTYSQPVSLMGRLQDARDSAAQPLQIIGNETTPANVVINPSTSYAVESQDHAYVLLAGLTLQNPTGILMMAAKYGMIEHRNCVLGACQNEKVMTFLHGTINAVGPTTVSGNCTSFVHATQDSVVSFSGQTITFSGSPVFSTYLWGINAAVVDVSSSTIVGTATGGITVHINGVLNVSSVTGKWTGGQAPLVETGGLIIAEDVQQYRTFYVRSDGDDTNDGMQNSAAHAFRTISGALTAIAKLPFDPIMWNATLSSSIVIQLSGPSLPATFNETVNLVDLKYSGCTIIGSETTPDNFVIAGLTDGVVATGTNTKFFIRGVKITAPGGWCLKAEQGAEISYENVDFGAANLGHVMAYRGGICIATGPYTITGAAPYHIRSYIGGVLDVSGQSVTLTGTLAFSSAFASAELLGCIKAGGSGGSFSGGTITGVRYSAVTNGAIDTGGGGASFFPGGTAGSTATGGQYT
jgi:YD repeat-containing protein